MVFDINYRFPRAYVHRHKVHQRPVGFTAEGPSEIHYLLSRIETMITDVETESERFTRYRHPDGRLEIFPTKKIYPSHPHLTADNHFSGEPVLNFAGEKGFGLTLTQRRDRFPKGLKPYCHHEKVEGHKDARAKSMRFGNPIVAISKVPATESTKAYTKTLVSFQSTGPTNICGVNNLRTCRLSAETRTRGIGLNKRSWGIEMNEARATYLNHYYAVDNVDHMIKNAHVKFISWKYWHSAMLHFWAMGVVSSYDMYRMACDGLLDPEWAVPESERMTFRDYRMILSGQMLEYHPKNGLLPGDEHFRFNTKQKKIRRTKRKREELEYTGDGVTEENYKLAKADEKLSDRLCGDLDNLWNHTRNMERTTNKGACEVCGSKTLWKCRRCNKFMCVLENRNFTGAKCVIRFHSDTFFGLAKSDNKMHENETWKPANENKYRRHAGFMKQVMRDMNDETALLTASI